jgi:hypothetical protein
MENQDDKKENVLSKLPKIQHRELSQNIWSARSR